MDIGPVEYLIISFPGNRFKGEIAPAIADLVERGTIRILDLAFVSKDADGTMLALEYDELDDAAGFVDIDGDAGGLLNEEDLELAAEALAPNSSALLIVWEDLWAAELAAALRSAGGVFLSGERIPHEIVELAYAGIDTSTEA
jgi:hypothetical protein